MKTILNEIIELAQILIRQESVSPSDGNLLQFIENYLRELGFSIEYFNFNETKNLYAKIGNNASFCFAGHIDIVPPGSGWKNDDAYSAHIENGNLYGRGTNDMKTTIACAMIAFKYALQKNPNSSLSILLTSDEEAAAVDGLQKVVPILQQRNEQIRVIILGEPASDKKIADIVKIGRRGSMTCVATVHGKQGHIAYPEHANNAVNIATKIALELDQIDFADENPVFGKSKLQMTNINAFNNAMNVIPGVCELRFGIRFNPAQNKESIKQKIEQIFTKYSQNYSLDWLFHGNAFVCNDERVFSWLEKSIQQSLQYSPQLDAKGATSDGRFLHVLAPCIEIGFQENMAHQVNECVAVDDIQKIYDIYDNLISNMQELEND